MTVGELITELLQHVPDREVKVEVSFGGLNLRARAASVDDVCEDEPRSATVIKAAPTA